jgi:hypothetical protein
MARWGERWGNTPEMTVEGFQVLGTSGGDGAAGALAAFILSLLRFSRNRNWCCFLLCLLFELAKKFPLPGFLR